MRLLAFVFLFPAAAFAESVVEPAPAGPRKLGGHFALGMPFVTTGSHGTSVVGRDFGTLALVGGINVGIDENWSVDFEFIMLANFADLSGQSATTFVLDPGVIYNWGPLWTGLRTAMRVPVPGASAEFGLVPIIGKSFPITNKVSYYFELDLPVFIQSRVLPSGARDTGATLTVFLQTGCGF